MVKVKFLGKGMELETYKSQVTAYLHAPRQVSMKYYTLGKKIRPVL